MNANLTIKLNEKICSINKREREISALMKIAQAAVTHSETSIKRKKVTLPHQDSPRKVKQKLTMKGNVNKKPSPPPRKQKIYGFLQSRRKQGIQHVQGIQNNFKIGVML